MQKANDAVLDVEAADHRYFARAGKLPVRVSVRAALEQDLRGYQRDFGQRHGPIEKRSDVHAHIDALSLCHQRLRRPGSVAHGDRISGKARLERPFAAQIALDRYRTTDSSTQVIRKGTAQPIPLEERNDDRDDRRDTEGYPGFFGYLHRTCLLSRL